jgi:hypothetical protein
VDRSGRGAHKARATGRRGQWLGRGEDLDLVDEQSEAVAQINQAALRRRSGRASKTSRAGSALPPMPSGCTSQRGGRGDGGADFQHVRAQHQRPRGVEMVGVIFHERRAARQAGGHHLHRPHQGAGLPIAFGPEAVAFGHEPLHREAGQLLQPVQVLEGVVNP